MGRLHVCNNECIHVCHLVFRLFNFTDNTSFIRPRSGLIHEFTINYSIIYFVVFCNFIKFICKIRYLITKDSVFFQTNYIACTVFFTLFIKLSVAKPLSPRRRSLISGKSSRYSSSIGCRKSTTPVLEY